MLRCVTVAEFKETFLGAPACESWEDFDSTMPKLASLIEGLLYYVAALEQSRASGAVEVANSGAAHFGFLTSTKGIVEFAEKIAIMPDDEAAVVYAQALVSGNIAFMLASSLGGTEQRPSQLYPGAAAAPNFSDSQAARDIKEHGEAFLLENVMLVSEKTPQEILAALRSKSWFLDGHTHAQKTAVVLETG